MLAAEQREQSLRALIGDRESLDTELLLDLEGLQLGAFLGEIRVDQVAQWLREDRVPNARELVEELRARLRDSVRAHLLADVPVGVLLSGLVVASARLTAFLGRRPATPRC